MSIEFQGPSFYLNDEILVEEERLNRSRIDPDLVNDPLVIKTGWRSIGDKKYYRYSYKLASDGITRLVFEPTYQSLLSSLLKLCIGVILCAVIVSSWTTGFPFGEAAFVIPVIPFAGVMIIIGLRGFYLQFQLAVTFDLSAGTFHRGRHFSFFGGSNARDKAIGIKSIRAVQLITKLIVVGEGDIARSTEMNLVLEDGDRWHITFNKDREQLIANALYLAHFLNVRLLKAI